MDLFWKCAAGTLVALILSLTLSRQERELGTVLAIAVCCMTGITALGLLEPVLDFLFTLGDLAGMEDELLRLLLRVAGVGLVTELVTLLCADAGNASLGKSIQLLGTSLTLYLSVPVFQRLIELIRELLGGL